MKIAIYNIKDYEKSLFTTMGHKHNLVFVAEALSLATIEKAKGCDGVCCFVTDCLNKDIVNTLADFGIKLIALRSAGFDHVDLTAARLAGITVSNITAFEQGNPINQIF